jgi:hypothetical protein
MQASEFADLVRRRHNNYLDHLAKACGIEPILGQPKLPPGQAAADDHAWRAVCYSWGLDGSVLDLGSLTVNSSAWPYVNDLSVLPIRQPGAPTLTGKEANVVQFHPRRLRRIA